MPVHAAFSYITNGMGIPAHATTSAYVSGHPIGADLGYVMPRPGVILGISARLTSMRSAGKLVIRPKLNNQPSSPVIVIDDKNTQQNYTNQTGRNAVSGIAGGYFTAGDLLSAQIKSDADWLPEDVEAAITIFVSYFGYYQVTD